MTIWEYPEEESGYPLIEGDLYLNQAMLAGDRLSRSYIQALDFFRSGKFRLHRCCYCDTVLRSLGRKEVAEGVANAEVSVQVCDSCGWWAITSVIDMCGIPYGILHLKRASGVLRNLDLSNIDIPTSELKQYLLARFSDRFIISPRKFEDIVAGVFSDFGYKVRVTSFSGDRGIDVIVFDGQGNDTVAIQVKRYKNKIEAEQIRSFAGALLLGGFTTGVFVTTSSFTKGAEYTTHLLQHRGIAVELCDANRFYQALKLAQRSIYQTPDDDSTPFGTFWHDPEKIPTIVQDSW